MKNVPVNLATQPIEQVQRVRRVLMLIGSLALAATVAHSIFAWWLLGVADEIGSAGPTSEASALLTTRLETWRQEVDGIVAAADPTRARSTADAVFVANELIAWRRLPWNELFAVLEATLPDDVRLELVQPANEPDGVQLYLVAAAPERSALQALLASLERQTVLEDVFPVREEVGSDGQYRMTLSARYSTPSTVQR